MLTKLIKRELTKRHGLDLMNDRIKPVHIANALYRESLGAVGKTKNLEYLFKYTARKASESERTDAMTKLLENSKERWGRLADTGLSKEGALGKRVLPMLRTVLGTDGAAFGSSPNMSSLTSPAGFLTTPDPSDGQAGALVRTIWTLSEQKNQQPSNLLALLKKLITPSDSLIDADDLTILLAPLAEETRPKDPSTIPGEAIDIQRYLDEGDSYDPILSELQGAAELLAYYETEIKPNQIASLERIISLACLTLFSYVSTRPHVWNNSIPKRPLLLQALNSPKSQIAKVSTASVRLLIGSDMRHYTKELLIGLLENGKKSDKWMNPDIFDDIVNRLADQQRESWKPKDKTEHANLRKCLNSGVDRDEVLREMVDIIYDNASVTEYLRSLGSRSGFLYPQNSPRKRLYLEDRVLEVIVASTVNVIDETVDYQEFLHRLWTRYRFITGGRSEDELLLANANLPRVGIKQLRQNSEDFLDQLESLGLARRLADSRATVGLLQI